MRSKVAQRILDKTPPETKIFVQKYAEIVLRIHEILKSQGLKQRELAEKMGKKPSEVSRWLKGEHNITLKSLAKLEAELGEEIISVSLGKELGSKLPRQELSTQPISFEVSDQLLPSSASSKPSKTSTARTIEVA